MTRFLATTALLPDGWAQDVLIEADPATGLISSVLPNATAEQSQGAAQLTGVVVPGMPNLHSHVFQIGMAGFAERSAPEGQSDDFWQWRDAMYRLAGSLDTETFAALAELAFVEMLEAGFTSVAEFHYVHRGPGSEPLERCQALIEVAKRVGIGLTLLPVFYAHSGFGRQPPTEGQQPFVHDLDSYAALLQQLEGKAAQSGVTLGIAPHSLRAVTPDQLSQLVQLAGDRPIHIHIAEQTGEVEACLEHHAARPVEWLLDNAPVGPNWCLIHATHMTEDETVRAAKTGAVAGLCPITEANLGDGLFNMPGWLADGGAFGVGSDSNVEISAPGELRLLDYGQRLFHRRRNLLPPPDTASATWLWKSACAGGAQALGQPVGQIAQGHQCDLVEIGADPSELTASATPDQALSWVLYRGPGCSAFRAVVSGGTAIVASGQHSLRSDPAFKKRAAAGIEAAARLIL